MPTPRRPRTTTDATSVRNIAEYLVAHPENADYQQHEALASLRQQFGFVRLLSKQRTQLLNQLGALLYQAHPELLRYCKDGFPQWVLNPALPDGPTPGPGSGPHAG